eukprot:TRINITY_DN40513_c0_g1_i1.p1 TRINITY_DN40513_c0_g1~~TRINITY_DN40513_c0_g1_i1.p1  ORF type:complete len:904 (-),score=136.31 TRINITY_DN40513_c0_g1_i1:227-2938(-)
MGCGPGKQLDDEAAPTRKTSSTSLDSDGVRKSQSRVSVATTISNDELKVHHDRLRKLRALDGSTKVPFILVELRGICHHNGFVEICGKDEYGVYLALDEWLRSNMKCTVLDAGDLNDNTPLPFSDALYKWDAYTVQKDGTNNMGLATMKLVEFMCGVLSWTLGVVNGGNVGAAGEIREQQVIFKAPHPMNLTAHHVMIELRTAGFIEVCGSDRESKDILHQYFLEQMGGTAVTGHQAFSDRYYQCKSGVFKSRKSSGENNLGLLTVQVCDAVVTLLPGWSLVTMNGGNYGESGTEREQQLVFRLDNHPLGNASHLLVEMREEGYVEVCGTDNDQVYSKLVSWLTTNWGCKDTSSTSGEKFYDRKLSWKPKDMMESSAELTGFFHNLGWQLQVCSQGTVAVKGNPHSREQQMLFRPGSSDEGHVEPHIFMELYTGEGKEDLYEKPEATQVLANQFIRIKEVGDCGDAFNKLGGFIEEYLGGGAEDTNAPGAFHTFAIDVFLSRGLADNNLGCWTMRMCDFMVDRLGWSFVVCNVCNLGPCGQFREQQLVFRFDGERREIPAVRQVDDRLDEVLFVGLRFPDYWIEKKVLSLKQPYSITSCQPWEIQAMQEIFDSTFKRVLTRDRVYEYQLNVSEEMPYRLEIVHAFRSENAELFRRFMERRQSYNGGSPCRAKTFDKGRMLNDRLMDGESLLAHGTNPSSAMGILKSGFVLSNAGKATGTMFGYGIYLAECVSKSDEYARDDNGGTFPGLMALLLCRCLVGEPYIVHDAGDHTSAAKEQGCDCVLGDRESKVNTYREFIFFDERQVLPEYAVIYRREYDQSKVPEPMRQPAKGTTGKNWQVKLEKGWANIPPAVSFELTSAERQNKETWQRKIGEHNFVFDFKKMVQTNMDTGTVRQIRQPMRR